MLLLMQLPVLRSLDRLTARVALRAGAVVKLVDLSLVSPTTAFVAVVFFTIMRAAGERRVSVFCYIMVLHALLGFECEGAMWVRTWSAVAAAHGRWRW